MSKLAAEIKQTKPFVSLEEEAVLNLARTYEFLNQRVSAFLKGFQLTPTQYNMLRILRGAGAEGISCSQACERMITPDPDVTRLLDRMESQGLIRRERSREDRRMVIARITKPGLRLTNQIDEPLQHLLRNLFGTVDRSTLQMLIAVLESLRDSANPIATQGGQP